MSLDSVPPLPSSPARRGLALGDLIAVILPLASVLVLGLHFYLASIVSAHFALALLLPLTVISFIVWPRFALCLLMAGSLFQYFWIGVFMDRITGESEMQAMSLTNPMVTNVLFLCSCLYLAQRWKGLPYGLKRAFVLGAIFVGVCAVFFVLGAARESFNSAFLYLRTYSGALIYLVLGAAFGLRLPFASVLKLLTPFGLLLAVYGYVEMLYPYDLYAFVHLTDFLHMKFASISNGHANLVFYGIEDTMDFLTVPFLNLSGTFGLSVSALRLVGPLFHFISYGYALAFFFLIGVISGRLWVGLLMVPVFVMIGAKGPIMLVLFTLGALLINRVFPDVSKTLKTLNVVLVLYACAVIAYGIASHDNHFDGFMSCVRGFLGNPLGHGVGVGGNMSDTSTKAQQAGRDLMAAVGDFPVESAIGVLMYQAGAAGLLSFLLFWRWRSRQARAFAIETQQQQVGKVTVIVLPAVLAILLVNALFQEEVFAPTGWGFWLLLIGVVLARRTQGGFESGASS